MKQKKQSPEEIQFSENARMMGMMANEAYLKVYGRDKIEEWKSACMEQATNFLIAGVVLQRKQWEIAAKCRECDFDKGPKAILAGGGRGSSKSHAILAQIFCDDCQRIKGLKVLCVRKVGRANKEQIQDFRKKLLGNLKHEYREQAQSITFENGSFVILGNFKDESDLDKYLGLEYDLIYIMESNQLTQSKKINILSCLRTNKQNWRPRCYQDTNPGGIDHCVPFGEVLTPKGWIDIKEIKSGDLVYSVLQGGSIIPISVSRTHKNYYEGKMISVDVRGLKMTCTPYHRIAKRGGVRIGKDTRDKISDYFSLVPFKDLSGQCTVLRTVKFHGEQIKSFTVPDTRKQTAKGNQAKVPKTITGEQYCELMGWFLSEGCATKRGDGNFRWSIAQMKLPQRAKIKKLLTECGFGFRESKTEFTLCGIEWWTYLNQFGKCRQKYVPESIKNCCRNEMWKFFEAFMDGDGHWVAGKSSGHAYTISKRLADDVSEIALKLGFVVSITTRQMPERVGLHYSVDFKTVKSGGTELLTGKHRYNVQTKTKRKSNISESEFSGMVYCLSVPTAENFILRQNGSIWISGNSANKLLFVVPWQEKREKETRYIHSTVDDNKFVNREYKEYLEKLAGWQREAWLHGSWDFLAGAYFTNFRDDVHIYPNQEVNLTRRNVRRFFGSFDYGFSHRTAFLLWAQDFSNNLYVIGEYTEAEKVPADHAECIKALLRLHELEPSDLDSIVAGHDCFHRKEEGNTIAQTYSENGIEFIASENARVNGWQRMLEMMGDPQTGTKPKFFIHCSCVHLIAQIKMAQHSEKIPGDIQKFNYVPGDAETFDDNLQEGDDCLDSCRIGLFSNTERGIKFALPVSLFKQPYQMLGFS